MQKFTPLVSHCATYLLKQNHTYCNIGCKIKINLSYLPEVMLILVYKEFVSYIT